MLAIGVQLVGAGRLDGVYLAVLPLAAVACFEVIAPLSQAFALQDANEAAARRLFELTDAAPAVVEAPARSATPIDPPASPPRPPTRPARPPSRSATCASATRRTSRGCSTG